VSSDTAITLSVKSSDRAAPRFRGTEHTVWTVRWDLNRMIDRNTPLVMGFGAKKK
jgi:hypothetical protein